MAIAWIILAQFVCVQLAAGTIVNVALGKPVNVSSRDNGRDPSLAVDGDRIAENLLSHNGGYGVMHTAPYQNDAWWLVDLQTTVLNPVVRIYFRTDYTIRRNGVQLYTSTTPFNAYPSGDLCYTVTGRRDGTDIPNVVSVNCSGPWQYLMVYTNTDNSNGKTEGPILDFGEVEVLVCSTWTYGINCTKSCSSRQCAVTPIPTTCDRFTGACPSGLCRSGYMGTDCMQVCTNETYGANCIKSCSNRHCSGTSASCDPYLGTCPGECAAGWMDTDCTQACAPGMYGPRCTSYCTNRRCRGSQSCNHVTGQCVDGCQAGWTGIECTHVCSGLTYGPNCEKLCSSRQCAVTPTSCNRSTGACPDGGCKAGYRTPDCAEVCESDMYGAGCGLSCGDRHCRSPRNCNHVTGRCDNGCQQGWNGTDCVQECPAETYGDNCSQRCSDRHCMTPSDTCDHVTGVCPSGCQPGWNGTDCKLQCLTGTYGANCVKACSARQCRAPSSCDRKTGQCSNGCQDGWNGQDCSTQCPNGTFGIGCVSCTTRHCKDESDCPGDGTCFGGCQEGWTLDNCTQACPSGTYGPGCSSSCGNCTVDDICDQVNGYCPGDCNTGWHGEQCKQACDPNTFGVNCKETCGHCIGKCISIDGRCPHGCEKGFNGNQCKLKDTDSYIIPVVAGIVAGLLVIIIVVIVIVVFRRRKASSKNSSRSQSHETVKGSSDHKENSEGGNMYVNVAYVENEAAKEKKEKLPVLKKTKPAIKPNNASPEILKHEQEEEIVEEDKPSKKGEYYNLGEDVIREIPVVDLANTIQKIKQRKGGFEAEYDRLPIGFTALYDDSQRPENAGKNKFRGYYPYDHNRVRLSHIPNIPGSDYINASLMHSYDQKKTYIAAQAPNKKTVGDFWRMIWEHRCNRVIMLTGLVEAAKVKCYKYWPDEDALETGQHTVEVEVTDVRANYTIRHLKISSKDGECRSIVQYHFTSWPDHGVPDTLALVHFIWMIRRTDSQTDGPLLVHCSAGIGRTGTYIAVDSLLDQARADGMVNVHGYVSVMRGQRKNMIQTKEQYECVFHCLVEMTTFGNTSMDVENFTTSYSSRGMGSMVDRKTIRELTQMATTEVRSDQPDRHKMWVDGKQDYTVRVGPTLRNVRGYLQTNAPPSGQEKLLWRLVEQNEVHNVVAISPLQVNLFGEKGTTMTYGDVTLKTTDMTRLTSDLTMATLQLHVTDGGTFQNVKFFQFSGSPTMDSMSSHLLDEADLQHLSLELSRVILIHSESDRKCAVLFCIMGNILSGLTEDRRIDVIGHARTFLKCCPGLIFTEQDFEKLHVFAQKCVQMRETSSTYANL